MIKVYLCDDCKTQDMNVFMLRHEVWEKIGTPCTYLCLPCTEKRLGRKVTLHDLRPCSISYTMLMGAYIGKNTPNLPSDEVLLDGSQHKQDHSHFTF